MSFSPAPIEIAKYTDDELTLLAVDARKEIAICESYEQCKPSLKEALSWIEWELGRRQGERYRQASIRPA